MSDPSRDSFAVPGDELKTHVLAGKPADTQDLRSQQNVDAFVLEQLKNGVRNIGIFIGDKLGTALDQRYMASQSAQSLA